MKRMPVFSSRIQSVGYNADERALEIEFKDGSVYRYDNVPEDKFQNLVSAHSIGSYFDKNIKTTYSGQRL